MKRVFVVMFMGIMACVAMLCPLQVAWGGGESVAQERVAYFELLRIRSLARPGTSYGEYRDNLAAARRYVGLLQGESPNVRLLRKTMEYYDQALTVWGYEADSNFAVGSLRTDEPRGAAILGQCPDIPRFHYKERDQIYVRDAVACIWRMAADVLDRVLIGQH